MTEQEIIELYAGLFKEIAIVRDNLTTLMNRHLPEELPRAQYELLNHLITTTNTNESPAEIARAFHVSKSAMTQLINRMKKKQVIEIKPTLLDSRKTIVSITNKGRTLHRKAFNQLIIGLKPLLDTLSDKELKMTLPLLHKLRLRLEDVAIKQKT